ncbi:MAG: hypothetical protein ACO1RT_08730 [Planctomycetaceae bacterium]
MVGDIEAPVTRAGLIEASKEHPQPPSNQIAAKIQLAAVAGLT